VQGLRDHVESVVGRGEQVVVYGSSIDALTCVQVTSFSPISHSPILYEEEDSSTHSHSHRSHAAFAFAHLTLCGAVRVCVWQGLLDRRVPASNITVALNGHAATKT
jgi:hypothetical protein